MNVESDPQGLFLLESETCSKPDTSAYHPNNVRCIAQTEAGPIFRIPLGRKVMFSCPQIPQELSELTKNRRSRDRIMSTLNLNSQIGPQEVGRPNSSFLFNVGGFFVDHLLEDRDHCRTNSPTLHTFMRETTDYNQTNTLFGKVSVLSGHIATFNSEPDHIRYIMSLDAFTGRDVFSTLPPKVKKAVRSLWANGIAPITADGYPITVG